MALPPLDELLAIKAPMLWLDEIVALEDRSLRCRLTLRSGQPFLDGERVEPLVAVEWMSQAACALRAVEARAQRQGVGRYVLSQVSEASFDLESFQLGDELYVCAAQGDGDAFACSVSRKGVVVARARLRLRQLST